MQHLLAWLESTGLARAVGESLSITAWLSAVHVIGFTLVMSGAVVFDIAATGLLLRGLPPASIARPSSRLWAAGLAISLLTGFALFAPRATAAAASAAFQLKMTLLLLATVFQLVLQSAVARNTAPRAVWLRMNAALGLLLWLSLAVTACWFILFE